MKLENAIEIERFLRSAFAREVRGAAVVVDPILQAWSDSKWTGHRQPASRSRRSRGETHFSDHSTSKPLIQI